MNKILSYLNILSFFVVAYLIIRFINISFYLNNYELLFIDERIIINDIYNVWYLEDEFYRYTEINNQFLKNLLIVITEFAYGGDLRYGRIWSNIFIILLGPLSLINDELLITSVRIFTMFIYFLSIQLLINIFLDKQYRWLYSIIFYSIPGVFYFNTAPKPDPLVILFIGISIYFLKKNKYNLSLLILGIATGIKIVGIFALLIVFLYILIIRKYDLTLTLIFKMLFHSWIGLVLANPILIIPPVNIGNLPNFYKIYYNWLDTQSMVAQQKRFSLDYFINWSENISIHFSYGLIKNVSLTFLIIALFIYLIYLMIINQQHASSLITMVGLIHLLFIFISVERQWKVYLNFSFIFLFIGLLSLLSNKKNSSIFLLVFYLTIVPLGLFRISQQIDSKSSIPNDDFKNIPSVIEHIENKYKELDNPINIVLWDPSYGMPRNNVTYESFFDVRENWEDQNLIAILNKADFFVTKDEKNFDGIIYHKIGDFFVYQKIN